MTKFFVNVTKNFVTPLVATGIDDSKNEECQD